MPDASDIAWFKTQFAADILPKLAGTPFDLDMIAAIACQETGEIWRVLRRKNLPLDRILALCVGDTIDARSVFPKSRADLESAPHGKQMFPIARAALVAMAEHIPGYAGVAKKPNKFCHGYGMFQYDIQFFKIDADYFLQRRYETFEGSFGRCLRELKSCLAKLGWTARTSLTDMEKAAVAITYNRGSFKPSLGLKQGHFDGQRFYGENFFAYLRLAHTVPNPDGAAPVLPTPAPGTAIVTPPVPVTATGAIYEVTVTEGTLNVRSTASKDPKAPNKNVIAQLPAGFRVTAVSATATNGFLEIETSLRGALVHGFASKDFLKRVATPAPVPPPPPPAPPPTPAPAPAMPTTGIIAAVLPRKTSSVTRRADPANAHSVKESGQPSRTGTTAAQLCADLAKIIDWLAVDNAAHKRYQPTATATFCNIYSHDYCHLAGVYLPRVWWNGPALVQLAQGHAVEAKYGATVDEVRANDLFRWLRDFGQRFGWRQSVSLTELQQEVNGGAVGLIVARRKLEGRSGHIVPVVPETTDHRARRNAAGQVVAPLQSQAGRVNFRYGTGNTDWWKSVEFAESAFWLHA